MGVCQGASRGCVSQGSEEGWMVRRCPLRAARTRGSVPRLQGVYLGEEEVSGLCATTLGTWIRKINGEMMGGRGWGEAAVNWS